MKKTSTFIILVFILFGFVKPKSDCVFFQDKKGKSTTQTILSDVYHIDTIYKSMMGPMSTEKIKLGSTYSTQLMWITGFEAMYPFLLSTQVLNLNNPELDIKVRHKIEIDYVTDSLFENTFTPLMVTSAYGVKALKKRQQNFDVRSTDQATYGQSCLVGTAARPRDITDKYGHKFTGHWIVPPGREVNYTNVTLMMNIPFNTTLHYISVHAHPFAESLELKDLTTGKSLFKSVVLNSEDKIGIEHAGIFSSMEGIPVYKDHEYQLISIYNNTSGTEQDAMAVMYLYLKDANYKYGK